MKDLNSKETAYLAGMYDGMLYAIDRLKKAVEDGESPEQYMKKKFWKQFLINLDARQRADNFFIKRDVIFDGGFEFWAPKQEGYGELPFSICPKQPSMYGGVVGRQLTCSCGSAMESCEEDPNGYYSRFFITENGPMRYLFELGTYQNGVGE